MRYLWLAFALVLAFIGAAVAGLLKLQQPAALTVIMVPMFSGAVSFYEALDAKSEIRLLGHCCGYFNRCGLVALFRLYTPWRLVSLGKQLEQAGSKR